MQVDLSFNGQLHIHRREDFGEAIWSVSVVGEDGRSVTFTGTSLLGELSSKIGDAVRRGVMEHVVPARLGKAHDD